jgi:DNA polymerase III delta prime subunit
MKYAALLQPTNYWEPKKSPGKFRSRYVTWLLEQQDNHNVSAVVGVRRAGKSTILKQVIYELITHQRVKPENTLIVNLEDPRLIELLHDNNILHLIASFKEQADLRSKLYVVFDEIQNVPHWEAIVRTLHDQEPNLKIFVTGSSAQLLGKELGTKLAGRYIKTEVFPFSFSEYVEFTGKNCMSFIQNGGFPDPVLTSNLAIKEQLLKGEDRNNFLTFGYKDDKNTSVEEIRDFKSSITTKVGSKNPVARIAYIKGIQNASKEAQNALLKVLEEPVAKTVIILQSDDRLGVVSTILSRCQIVPVLPLSEEQALLDASNAGMAAAQAKKAYLMSYGDAETFAALLKEDSGEISEQLESAKDFLRMAPFERLQLQKSYDTTKNLEQLIEGLLLLAGAGLHNSTSHQTKKWKVIVSELQTIKNLLRQNVLAKALFLRLCISL